MTCGNCGTPTAGATLCDGCARTYAYAVANIAAYATDLDTIRTKAARYSGANTGGRQVGKVQPMPVDARFADALADGSRLAEETRNTVGTWARVVMDDAPELAGPTCRDCLHTSCATIKRRRWPKLDTTDATTGQPTASVKAMCLYLDRMHRLVENADYGPTMLDELCYLERQLRRMVDRPQDRWYAGRCDCGEDMYAKAGARTVDCRECDASYDVATRRDFLLAEARDVLVTATEAAGALSAWTEYDGSHARLRKRISEWADEKRLTDRGAVDMLGRERTLYRLGDVEALLIDHMQRMQQRRARA